MTSKELIEQLALQYIQGKTASSAAEYAEMYLQSLAEIETVIQKLKNAKAKEVFSFD